MKKVHIIGAGLGGLSAAISLAQSSSFEIHIHEKNAHLGGKLNLKEKQGFSFDLGPSIFTMPHLFEPLFTMHNKSMRDYFTLTKVRPHWRNVFEDKTILDLHESLEKTVNENSVLKPYDLKELKGYYEYAKKTYDFSNKVMFENMAETKLSTLKYYNPFKIIKDSDMFHTMSEGVNNYISNTYLKDTLNFFIKYVGSNPYEAPAIMNLLPYIQWEFDLWYVKGGLFNLSRGLEKLAKEVGVHIHLNHEVTNVIQDKKSVNQIEVNQEILYDADYIISNMEVLPFYEKLTNVKQKPLKKYRKKYPPASSGFAIHLGVNKTYDILKHHNIFHAKSSKKHFHALTHERTLSDDPTIYLVAPMKSDKTIGPKDTEIIKILPHIPPIDPNNPYTEKEYETFKKNLYIKLERMGLTDLRKHIITEEVWTPHSLLEAYYSDGGSIYGTLSDKKKNLGFKHKKQSTFFKNVYFVGGTTNPGGGMPMVVLSGQQTASKIIKTL